MIVSYNWLKEFVRFELDPFGLADKLTMAGFEVDFVERVPGDGALVGGVLNVERYRDLFCLEVDVGGEEISVVSNTQLCEGDKIAVVRAGSRFGDKEVKEREFRSRKSQGVLLGYSDFGFEHEEIVLFDKDEQIGRPLRDMDEFNDWLLEIEITPNRGDALSMLGIAREVAAICGKDLYMPEISYTEADRSLEDYLYVRVEDNDLCPRYCLFGAEVSVFRAPFFMRMRLVESGVRPINNVVDITNYVMLALGQPLHGFDMKKLRGGIIVRRSRGDERVIALDEKEYLLSPDMLAIADEDGPVAIAGVMGGEMTKIDEHTTLVALESAHFNPVSVRKTSRALRLRSESSYRFERGVDPGLCEFAGKYALSLMGRYANGRVFKGHFDVRAGDFEGKVIDISPARVNALLGTDLGEDAVLDVLGRLDFNPVKVDDCVRINVPTYRFDVSMEADIAEEIARVLGYDKIPSTVPSVKPGFRTRGDKYILREELLSLLPSLGLHECISYSFVNESREKLFGMGKPVKVLNPLTEDQAVMRTSIIVSLMENLSLNISRGVRSVPLFELARVFRKEGSDIEEREHLGVLLYGFKPLSLYSRGERYDFYDIKGVFEAILDVFGVAPEFKASDRSFMHPKRSASIWVEGREIGFLGELHPSVYMHYSIEFGRLRILVGEMDLDYLVKYLPVEVVYERLPKLPTVIRDISVVVDDDKDAMEIGRFILSHDKVYRVALFDHYDKLSEPGKKSLTYRLILRDDERTFREEEIEDIIRELIESLSDTFGARLRG